MSVVETDIDRKFLFKPLPDTDVKALFVKLNATGATYAECHTDRALLAKGLTYPPQLPPSSTGFSLFGLTQARDELTKKNLPVLGMVIGRYRWLQISRLLNEHTWSFDAPGRDRPAKVLPNGFAGRLPGMALWTDEQWAEKDWFLPPDLIRMYADPAIPA